MAAATVAAAVRFGVPHEAWLPTVATLAPAEAWAALLQWPLPLLADLQVAIGRTAWPADAVAGATGVAAACAAATALVQSVAVRASGLGAPQALLLALVATAAPLQALHASSPLGAAPASLISALLLWQFTRHRTGVHATWVGNLTAIAAVILAILLLFGLSQVLARWWGLPGTGETLRLLRGDLGTIGLVLLLPALGRREADGVARERVWLGIGLLWLLTVPVAPTVRAAVLLPWVWWLVGAGLAQVLGWREHRASRWALVGLACWTGLHAARVPWGQQRQLASLTRAWAEGIAAAVDGPHPLVREDSARGRLAGALVAPTSLVEPDAVRRAVEASREPIVVGADTLERLRWGGLAIDAIAEPVGVSLERLLDRLPGGTIVLAAISRDAAGQLTPAQWQALGRVGLRLPDAAVARAHVLVGVTRARVDALEAADVHQARIDVMPGDLLGRTGVRSPVDAQIEADARAVRVGLRSRPFLDERGLVVLLFSTRGDFLGWRAGRHAGHLDGPPLGAGPLARGRAVASLPCVEVATSAPTDITAASRTGTLGLTWRSGGIARLEIERPAALRDERATRVAEGDRPPASAPAAAGPLTLDAAPAGVAGVLLRGPVERVTATGAGLRACAAWPLPYAVDPATEPVALPAHPRFDALFAAGWHDLERAADGAYFRWMSGPRAGWSVPLRQATRLRLELDAQPVASPREGDQVRLVVNGVDAGGQALRAGRGVYAWELSEAPLRSGLNEFELSTSLVVRPSDITAGADARRLGLAVYGWTLDGR